MRCPGNSGSSWKGQIEYKIGSLPIFLADQGDIVYVPKGMWHRAHHGGTGTSTRLAMNGYPEMLHNYQPNAELRWFTWALHKTSELSPVILATLAAATFVEHLLRFPEAGRASSLSESLQPK
jgi:hypothetical protein